MIRSFRDLVVYQKSYALSLEIHKISLGFPRFEQFELANQMRRASKSIAMNIAEGFSRKLGAKASLADFKRFLIISLGSADETRVCLDFCKDLGYITAEQHESLENNLIEIIKILLSMHSNWK